MILRNWFIYSLAFVFIVTAVIYAGLGFTLQTRATGNTRQSQEKTTQTIKFDLPSDLRESNTPARLVEFNRDNYRQAVEEFPIVMLYFNAGWCSPCYHEMRRVINPVFSKLPEDLIVGLVVPWHDQKTNRDSQVLSNEFGITRPQTKVFLINGRPVKTKIATQNILEFQQSVQKSINRLPEPENF